jgi:hypothetical protein
VAVADGIRASRPSSIECNDETRISLALHASQLGELKIHKPLGMERLLPVVGVAMTFRYRGIERERLERDIENALVTRVTPNVEGMTQKIAGNL